MLQVFQEAHVLQAGTDAPGTHHGGTQDAFTGDVGVAVEGEVGEVVVAVGAHHRHALGTVAGVVVITGGVPAVQAGSTPIQLVFQQQAGQPAFAVHLLVSIGSGTVVHIPGDAEGIPVGHFAGHASPEGIAVGVIVIGTHKTGHQALGSTSPSGTIALGAITIHAGTHGSVHDPGGHLHAVEGQGQQHGEHVHVVHVVVPLATSIGALVTVVVVVRTGPESGQAHVFVELVVQADGGHVIVEDLGSIGGEGGQSQALDTHADLQVGLGHHPVDVGALQFHHAVVVSTQGAAGVILAPDLVADFEEHGTGQGFRSHGVQLQADTLAGFEFVFVLEARVGGSLALTKVTVHAVVERHDPLALGLEVDSVGAGSGTQHHSGSQSESHKLLHDIPSFITSASFDPALCGIFFPCGTPSLPCAERSRDPGRYGRSKSSLLKVRGTQACLPVELVKIFKPLLSVCQYYYGKTISSMRNVLRYIRKNQIF